MSNRTGRWLMLLPWLSLPVLLSAYVTLWDRVPPTLAVHFDAGGTPNGWMSRRASVAFDAAILLLILVAYTLKLKGRGPAAATQLVLFNVVILFVTCVFLGILKYNVSGSLF